MEYYGIKLFNIIIFDYCEDGVFNVKIYKKAEIEINYHIIDVNKWKKINPE